MKNKRWHLLATCIVLTITFVVSAVAIRLPSQWRDVSAAEATTNPEVRDEVVISQPRSFKKAQLEFERIQMKGAPFSAELTIETPQFSRDGTSKLVDTHSLIYRDKDGRTRREEKSETGAQSNAGAKINDIVAGLSYVLEPRLQVARKRALESADDTVVTPAINQGSMSSKTTGRYQVLPSGTTSTGVDSSGSMVNPTAPTVTKNLLGERLIEGIKVEGTRLTTTHAANSFGNSQPIVIVEERWYSPELRTMVMIKYSDPRFGDSFYRFSDISRTEPLPTLFVVPEKYTVKDDPAKDPHRR
jgi:hypothetical protein